MPTHRHSYISSLQDVEVWFRQKDKPNWKLLRGFHDKTRGKATICVQDEEGVDMDTSWQLLQQMLEINSGSGGQFTVFVPTSTSGQGESIFVQLGDVSSTIASSLSGAPAVGYVPKTEVQEILAKERKMWELERKLEDLEAAQEANFELKDIWIEKLREIDPTPIINGLMAQFTGRPVTLQGTAGDYAPPTPVPEEGFAYQGEKLMPILDDIREQFHDEDEFYTFLGKLRDMFLQNPELYKNMVDA